MKGRRRRCVVLDRGGCGGGVWSRGVRPVGDGCGI